LLKNEREQIKDLNKIKNLKDVILMSIYFKERSKDSKEFLKLKNRGIDYFYFK